LGRNNVAQTQHGHGFAKQLGSGTVLTNQKLMLFFELGQLEYKGTKKYRPKLMGSGRLFE